MQGILHQRLSEPILAWRGGDTWLSSHPAGPGHKAVDLHSPCDLGSVASPPQPQPPMSQMRTNMGFWAWLQRPTSTWRKHFEPRRSSVTAKSLPLGRKESTSHCHLCPTPFFVFGHLKLLLERTSHASPTLGIGRWQDPSLPLVSRRGWGWGVEGASVHRRKHRAGSVRNCKEPWQTPRRRRHVNWVLK